MKIEELRGFFRAIPEVEAPTWTPVPLPPVDVEWVHERRRGWEPAGLERYKRELLGAAAAAVLAIFESENHVKE